MKCSAMVASALLALMLGGCGGGTDDVQVPPNSPGKSDPTRPSKPKDGGTTGDGDGETGDGDGETGDGDATTDPRAPVVELVSPTAALDPNEDEILTDPMVTVRCRVTKSADPDARDVDQSSVSIDLFDVAGEREPVIGAVNALTDNEFEANFQLAELPNGPVRFACRAKDVGEPALAGSNRVDTFLDLGPSIKILDPVDEGRYALKNPIVIRFEVKPDPVSDDDTEASVTDVVLQVIDQVMVATEDPKQAGLYTLSVDFDDRTLFPMRPSTAEVKVTASSSRSPAPATRTEAVSITVDAVGPTINVTSPADTSIVRGQVTLAVTITDPSGVRRDSVIGQINSGRYTLDDWTVVGDMYQAQFDTRASVFDELTELTINITAEDSVGNSQTAQHLLRLDNLPPLVTLDPPLVREYYEQNQIKVCSAAFDPVGDDAANDLDVKPASSLYRVLAFDQTNGSEGGTYKYFAGVAPGTVRLFAQKKLSIPLLTDTNGDGVCDEINSEALPLADRPVLLELDPLTPRGTAFYGASPAFNDPQHTAFASCTAGTAMTPPPLLCPFATALYRAIPAWYDSQPLDSAIYALNPTNTTTGACEGNSWELLGVVGSEGWVCLAARAEDRIGNIGVSPPMRICLDDGAAPSPGCLDLASNPPPSCTDGCTPPPNLSPDTMLPRR